MVDFHRDIWVAKEFAEDYSLDWDILIKRYNYVHINDVNAAKVFAKIYYDSLSRWRKIKYKLELLVIALHL